MICFGLANTIAAALASAVAKVVGRNKILMLTLVLHGTLLMWMRQWVAVPNDFVAYCSMAAIWGLLDGTWLVIINCKCCVCFLSLHFPADRYVEMFEPFYFLQLIMAFCSVAKRRLHSVIFACSNHAAQ